MHWLRLPEPRRDIAPAFNDAESAQAWLGALASTPPLAVFSALLEQIQAIDGAAIPPAHAVSLLNQLRAAAVPLQSVMEEQFTRKALPMLAGEEHAFEITHRLWMQFGIAYLRLAPQCTPANRALPLHRATTAFRLAQYCHFLAARTCPPISDHLLLMALAAAEANGVLRRPLADPDFPQHGKGSISGQLAWAILMNMADAYHLTAIQLPVVNRLYSRWRELVSFQAEPDRNKETYVVDLAALFDDGLPPGVPRYLNLRPIAIKLGQRIKLLGAGESPEALKLGRSLSAAAAIRLLRDLEQYLQPPSRTAPQKKDEIELVFGSEDAYALLRDTILNPVGAQKSDQPLVYQRKAVFGIVDQSSPLRTKKSRQTVPGEHWKLTGNLATRAPQPEASRRLAPTLIAALVGGSPSLGVMTSLQCDDDGTLSGRLRWYDEEAEACNLKRLAPKGNRLVRVPAFVLRHKWGISLVLPADAGARLSVGLDLADCSVEQVIPTEIVDRGSDFIHYACKLP